jgi:hypothetical protein
MRQKARDLASVIIAARVGMERRIQSELRIGKILALQLYRDGISLHLDYVRNPYCGFDGLRKTDLEFIKCAVVALRSSSSSRPPMYPKQKVHESLRRRHRPWFRFLTPLVAQRFDRY